MEKEFDIVVFGATGFTGNYVVEYLAKISETHRLRWAIAGRNAGKLKAVLENVSSVLGKNIRYIEKIEADIDNEESLNNMCQRAKLIMNCVGPYRFYGEPVVKACIENGTHHVDLSAEAVYLESMQLKYHEKAQQAKVYIVQAVGYGSIPSETGLQFLQQHFKGDLQSAEIIYEVNFGLEVTKLHYGTYESVVRHAANYKELKPIRRRLFEKGLPENSQLESSRRCLSYCEEINKWCLKFKPIPHTDFTPIMQTQYYNYHIRKMQPIHVNEGNTSIVLPNVWLGICGVILLPLVAIIARLKWAEYLTLKFPRLFTLGMISHKGPTRQQLQNSRFATYVIGRGYDNTSNGQRCEKREKKMLICVSGPDPAYIGTSLMAIQSALTILQETDKLPDEGGVYSCGAAFLNTTLISRLSKEGIKYQILKENY